MGNVATHDEVELIYLQDLSFEEKYDSIGTSWVIKYFYYLLKNMMDGLIMLTKYLFKIGSVETYVYDEFTHELADSRDGVLEIGTIRSAIEVSV